MTTEKLRMGKRKRQEPPSPSKNSSSCLDSPPMKKKVSRSEGSPSSSPLKGLIPGGIENSPSFAAKSFYGIRQSHVKNKNVLMTPPINDVSRNVRKKGLPSESCGREKEQYALGNGKRLSPNSRLNEKMWKLIENSPVKQAILETCSVEQFRKLYKNEFVKLEEELQKKNRRFTRSSRIVKFHDGEDDDDADEEEVYEDESDDEVSFKVHGGLDFEETAMTKTKLRTPDKSSYVSDILQELEDSEGNESCDESGDESCDGSGDEAEAKECLDHAITPTRTKVLSEKGLSVTASRSTPPAEIDQATTPSSCERKFFKTRSPLDNSKMRSIFCGKSLILNFPPKQCRKTGKGATKSRSSQSRKKLNVMKGQVSTDSRYTQSQESSTSGFSFAPGFLSPKKQEVETRKGSNSLVHEDNTCLTDTEHECAEVQNDLSVNKVSSKTYEVSTPRKDSAVTISKDTSLDTSDRSSLSSSVDLLPERIHPSVTNLEAASSQKNGSQDLLSSQNQSEISPPEKKLFPIFAGKGGSASTSKQAPQRLTSPKSGNSTPVSKISARLVKEGGQSQMILDAGQKKFGVTQCQTCSMVYCQVDPADEAAHAKFHKRLVEVLKFPGWKNERVVQEYPMDMSRVLMVLADDPKHVRKKMADVNQVMGRELGFPDVSISLHPHHKVFLYISSEKRVDGCCVAEPISTGYRIIPGNLDNNEASGQRPWCCTNVPESAAVGISRLWVAASGRRCGVATKLVDCVRQWFDYGTLIPKHMLAFSDPTPDGRLFAQKYLGVPTFLVYKYKH